MMKTNFAGLLTILLALAVAGCESTNPKVGYTSRSLFDQSIRTVEVRIFSSKEFRRGLEFELTEALVKRIEADTPYKVVKGSAADTVLEGQLVFVRQAVLSDLYESEVLDESGLPAEKQQQMRVNFTWKDRRNGQILVQGDKIRVVAEYTPKTGEEFFTGQQELMDKMARKIVNSMRESW